MYYKPLKCPSPLLCIIGVESTSEDGGRFRARIAKSRPCATCQAGPNNVRCCYLNSSTVCRITPTLTVSSPSKSASLRQETLIPYQARRHPVCVGLPYTTRVSFPTDPALLLIHAAQWAPGTHIPFRIYFWGSRFKLRTRCGLVTMASKRRRVSFDLKT